jgi:hypothetical protein
VGEQHVDEQQSPVTSAPHRKEPSA